MASRRKKSPVGQYILIASVALVVLAVAGIGIALAITMIPGTLITKTDTAKGKAQIGAASQRATAAVSQESPPRAAPVEKPIAIRVDDLRQQYANNESAADQKFKNKQLEITGAMTGVIDVSPLIGIAFGSPQDSVPPVFCEMDPKQRDQLAKLTRGQVITIRGTCIGRSTGDGSIGLSQCQIIATGK